MLKKAKLISLIIDSLGISFIKSTNLVVPVCQDLF